MPYINAQNKDGATALCASWAPTTAARLRVSFSAQRRPPITRVTDKTGKTAADNARANKNEGFANVIDFAVDRLFKAAGEKGTEEDFVDALDFCSDPAGAEVKFAGFREVLVPIPEGVSPGQQLEIESPYGGKVGVVVPPGVASGQHFSVKVPVTNVFESDG